MAFACRAPTSESAPPKAAAPTSFRAWRRETAVAIALESSSNLSSLMERSSSLLTPPPVARRSFRLCHTRLLSSRRHALGETQDLGRPFGHVASDDAFLVDQECNGRREDSVLL